MKNYWQIMATIVVAILLSGCNSIGPSTGSKAPISDNSVTVMEPPPELISTDWHTILRPLIDELLETANVSQNNTLLISDIKNNSNEYISSIKINDIILNAFSQQTIFNVINNKEVNQAKQSLGIPAGDSLVSRSKMIGLARYVKADYVLFTTINQVPTASTKADVSMELLLTQTGEIVWRFSSNQIVND